ncbi:MAG: nickel-dependent hydrogenase large subunit [Holophagaceae bacterium]|nr:nickel-dependent hydrogenase large subunit [Holophagaceae bacterium]
MVTINAPLNRVEGDLEVSAEITDGVVSDAWCSGTMYRGIEKILVGRGPMDGLVITPRICGICSTSHLTAAAKALDCITGAVPPPDAVRMRNALLMTEHIQSDLRHTFLTFTGDFTNPAHSGTDRYTEAVRRYEPMKGDTVLEVLRETSKLLEIIAIIGGQWPHSSFMVPGGIVSAPSVRSRLQCKMILRHFRGWYERRILGCSIERIQELESLAGLGALLDDCALQPESDLSFFISYARSLGLHKIGRGHGSFLCYGALELPQGTAIKGAKEGPFLVPAGFAQGGQNSQSVGFDQANVAEHVAHSWYEDYRGGLHPAAGETRPYATGYEAKKYSWAKAPRYDGFPAETGPLAEMVMAGRPLFKDLLEKQGPSAFARQLARLLRPAWLIPTLEAWLEEVTGEEGYYQSPEGIQDGEGFGLTQASRGALGHWVRIRNGAIDHYQIISPTGWNASPRDSAGIRGPIEEALIGTPVRDPENPVELGFVVRSFDVCLVCTVHALHRGGRTTLRMTRA